jgi:hypothetical protein
VDPKVTEPVLLELLVDGAPFATYLAGGDTALTSAPRPFLHPVRTPGGIVVTDAHPEDHDWHLGACVAVQDVGGTNLWGGRTYVAGSGYEWRDDHGRIEHDAWTERGEDRAVERLVWRDRSGGPLLHERRELSWSAVADGVWRLGIAFSLEPAGGDPVALGSPGSAGRKGAGYGGFFWRLPPSTDVDVRMPGAAGERECHGRTGPWLAWSAAAAGGDYTLVFTADAPDPWFVRVKGYPGVGAALAWDAPVAAPLARSYTVYVADGRLSTDSVNRLAV